MLTAYVKIALAERLGSSTLPDEPWFGRVLRDYFPQPIAERFADQLAEHPLHREIITTCVVNDLVNRGGSTFVFRAMEETAADPAQIARAYTVVREVFGLEQIWASLEALDNQVSTDAQHVGYREVRRTMDRAVRWLVDVRFPISDVTAEIERFGPTVAELTPKVPQLLRGRERENLYAEVDRLVGHGLPRELALEIACLLMSFLLLDVVEIAVANGRPAAEVADLHFALSERLSVDDILSAVTALPRDDRWSALARAAIRHDVYAALAALTASALKDTDSGDAGHRAAGGLGRAEPGAGRAGPGHLRRGAVAGRGGPGHAVGGAAGDARPAVLGGAVLTLPSRPGLASLARRVPVAGPHGGGAVRGGQLPSCRRARPRSAGRGRRTSRLPAGRAEIRSPVDRVGCRRPGCRSGRRPAGAPPSVTEIRVAVRVHRPAHRQPAGRQRRGVPDGVADQLAGDQGRVLGRLAGQLRRCSKAASTLAAGDGGAARRVPEPERGHRASWSARQLQDAASPADRPAVSYPYAVRGWLNLACAITLRDGVGYRPQRPQLVSRSARCPQLGQHRRRPVGDDRVHAQLAHQLDVGGLVHRPAEHLVAGLVGPLDVVRLGAQQPDAGTADAHPGGQRAVAAQRDQRSISRVSGTDGASSRIRRSAVGAKLMMVTGWSSSQPSACRSVPRPAAGDRRRAAQPNRRSSRTSSFSTSPPYRVGCLVSISSRSGRPASATTPSSISRVSTVALPGRLAVRGDAGQVGRVGHQLVGRARQLVVPGPEVQLLQAGQVQLADDAAAVGGAVDGAVVHADQVAVPGQPDVALQAVGAGVDGSQVGGQGVLGDVAGGTPVGDHQRVRVGLQDRTAPVARQWARHRLAAGAVAVDARGRRPGRLTVVAESRKTDQLWSRGGAVLGTRDLLSLARPQFVHTV